MEFEKKIDRRKNYMIVLDCETAPCDRECDEVMPRNMLVYDLGWAVVDKYGNVYESRSFVVADIFLEEKVAMDSAYYANKIPKYWEDIKSGNREMRTLYNVHKALLDDIAEYGVTKVFAHNMRFDYGSLNNTYRWVTKSKYRYFFPKEVEICDTLKLSRQVIQPMPTYRKWCEEHGYTTSRNQPRLTAEILYRFISGDYLFEESHTGLEDVMIEKEILAYCYRKHKKMNGKLWAD